MNPQNNKVQVHLRHSLLWRKPLLYDQPVQSIYACHSQLNSFATTGQNWRYRNNMISTRSKLNSKTRITRVKTESSINDLFQEHKPQITLRQSMIKSLKTQSSHLEKMSDLVEGMKKLKNLNLIQHKSLFKITYEGKRSDFVRNDYHSRLTSGGFGRSHQGRFYTK